MVGSRQWTGLIVVWRGLPTATGHIHRQVRSRPATRHNLHFNCRYVCNDIEEMLKPQNLNFGRMACDGVPTSSIAESPWGPAHKGLSRVHIV
jgi:hypothetical protein